MVEQYTLTLNLDLLDPQTGDITMRKLIVAAVAATSFLLAASAANAGYWWNGFYYPTCVYTIYGPVCG